MNTNLKDPIISSETHFSSSSQIDGSPTQLINHITATKENVNHTIGTPASSSTRYCRTLFLSDIHLGTKDCKAKECRQLLKSIHAEKIVLVGDIIDAWALARRGKWRKSHTQFIRTLLKITEKENTPIIYLRGNHDDILDRLIPFHLASIQISKEYIHTSATGDKYLCLHGDGFDAVTTHVKFLAILGSFGYDVLLTINRLYNAYRHLKGKDYFSISQYIKSKVKSAVSFISRYEEELYKLAKKRECQGIIAGHLHQPEDRIIDNIHYLNCGDWVETMSAIIENPDGSFEMIYHPSAHHS